MILFLHGAGERGDDGLLQTEVEALRSLVYRACEGYLAGQDVTMLASMSKLKVPRYSAWKSATRSQP